MSENDKKAVDELTLVRSVQTKLKKVDSEAAARILNYATSWNDQRRVVPSK